MDEILKDIANLILNGTNEKEKTPAGYHVELVGAVKVIRRGSPVMMMKLSFWKLMCQTE